MTAEQAREMVAQEMDYWREWMLGKVRITRGRTRLIREEVIVCATLAAASAMLQRPERE